MDNWSARCARIFLRAPRRAVSLFSFLSISRARSARWSGAFGSSGPVLMTLRSALFVKTEIFGVEGQLIARTDASSIRERAGNSRLERRTAPRRINILKTGYVGERTLLFPYLPPVFSLLPVFSLSSIWIPSLEARREHSARHFVGHRILQIFAGDARPPIPCLSISANKSIREIITRWNDRMFPQLLFPGIFVFLLSDSWIYYSFLGNAYCVIMDGCTNQRAIDERRLRACECL